MEHEYLKATMNEFLGRDQLCECIIGEGDMSIFEYAPRKWPKTHTQKLFLSIFE